MSSTPNPAINGHVLYLLSVVESTEPKQVYSGKLGFVSERTIKDIIIICKRNNQDIRLTSCT